METLQVLKTPTAQGVFAGEGGASLERGPGVVPDVAIAFGGLRQLCAQHGMPPGRNGNLEM